MTNNNIIVSVCCMTYNQEKYIKETLLSILNQKTNFEFEIIIHDDASKDDTVSIIKELAKNNKQIKPIFQKENKHSQGILIWYKYMFPICQGNYIALCDGDDYWTDPYKLQKQVDFLETAPEYGISCHEAKIYFENENKFKSTLEWKIPKVTSIRELSKWNMITTNSVVLRNDFNMPEWSYNLPIGDWPLYISQLKNRKIYRFPEEMSVYRVHENGIWSSTSEIKKLDIDIGICRSLKIISDVTKLCY